SRLMAYMEAVDDSLSNKAYRDKILEQIAPDRNEATIRHLEEIMQRLEEVTKAKARAVRAYVELGSLSDDEFAAQKSKLDKEESALQREQAKLQKEVKRQEEESKIEDRLLDIAAHGRQIL